jgi:hypothetical protein
MCTHRVMPKEKGVPKIGTHLMWNHKKLILGVPPYEGITWHRAPTLLLKKIGGTQHIFIGYHKKKKWNANQSGYFISQNASPFPKEKKLLNKVPSIYTKSFMPMVYPFLGVNMYVVAYS